MLNVDRIAPCAEALSAGNESTKSRRFADERSVAPAGRRRLVATPTVQALSINAPPGKPVIPLSPKPTVDSPPLNVLGPSTLYPEQILEHDVVQNRVRQHPIQLDVLPS